MPRLIDFLKNFCYNNYSKNEKGVYEMSVELVKALLVIVRACAGRDNCEECPLKDFCGKSFQSL